MIAIMESGTQQHLTSTVLTARQHLYQKIRDSQYRLLQRKADEMQSMLEWTKTLSKVTGEELERIWHRWTKADLDKERTQSESLRIALDKACEACSLMAIFKVTLSMCTKYKNSTIGATFEEAWNRWSILHGNQHGRHGKMFLKLLDHIFRISAT